MAEKMMRNSEVVEGALAAGAPEYAGAEDTRGVLRAGGSGGEATATVTAAGEDEWPVGTTGIGAGYYSSTCIGSGTCIEWVGV